MEGVGAVSSQGAGQEREHGIGVHLDGVPRAGVGAGVRDEQAGAGWLDGDAGWRPTAASPSAKEYREGQQNLFQRQLLIV